MPKSSAKSQAAPSLRRMLVPLALALPARARAQDAELVPILAIPARVVRALVKRRGALAVGGMHHRGEQIGFGAAVPGQTQDALQLVRPAPLAGDRVDVPDAELGPIKMQNVFPKLSRTPGRIKHAAPTKGEHNEEVFVGRLGLDPAHLAQLRAEGVI